MWCRESRRGAVRRSLGRQRGCAGVVLSSSSCAKRPCARKQTKRRERGARGSEGRRGDRRRGLERAAVGEAGGGQREGERARVWAGPGSAPLKRQKLDGLVEAAPDTRSGCEVRERHIIERRSTLRGRPGSWQGGNVIARRLGERVLAACRASLGGRAKGQARRARV